jgi:peptide/nickel transport system permease protein
MLTLLARRLAQLLPTIFFVSVIIFLLQQLLPGDPATVMAGEEADAEAIAQIKRQYRLDQPLPLQYLHWIGGVLTGDLGESMRLKVSVADLVIQKFPVTLQLALMAIVIAVLIGVTAGVVSAVKRDTWWDYAVNALSLWGISTPNFWLGIMLILLFSVQLGWLPASGYVSPFEDFWGSMQATIMPAFVLGNSIAGVLMRHTRASMLEALQSDYVRTARAKGQGETKIILKHVMRNALTPVITLGALEFGTLLSGAVLTEQIFTIPGFGKLIVDAVFNRDYAVVQGVVLVTATTYILLNLLADIGYILINPRLRETPVRRAWARLKRRKGAMVALAVLVVLATLAVLAPLVAPHDPIRQGWATVRKPPSAVYWFGTDEVGRDLFSRIIYGARASLSAGVISVTIALLLGVPIGLLAGYRGGWVDAVISRFTDAMLACPFLILAIAMAAFLGPSLTNAMIAIGVTAMPIFIRLTRGQVIAVKVEEYVEAARSVGSRPAKIALRHILPNVAPQLLVQATLTIATAIIAEAALSFLGLGQQPPAPSWGSMLNTAQRFLSSAPWMAIFPGLAIFVTVLSFNLLGDGLRDALDPRTGER